MLVLAHGGFQSLEPQNWLRQRQAEQQVADLPLEVEQKLVVVAAEIGHLEERLGRVLAVLDQDPLEVAAVSHCFDRLVFAKGCALNSADDVEPSQYYLDDHAHVVGIELAGWD